VKDVVKIAAILFIVCGLAAGGLSFVNLATKDRIAAFAEEERVAAFKRIFPTAESFTERPPADAGGVATEWDAVAGGAIIGRVQQLKPLGYSGTIRLVYGVDASGALTGVQVLEHTETPGLGAKITTAWIDQFKGRTRDEVALKKDGGAIDAIAAATISSRAVTQAVHDAMSGGF
jgi:Na+-translocating ferredoxin:NAD+ oxidoreductase subunit G